MATVRTNAVSSRNDFQEREDDESDDTDAHEKNPEEPGVSTDCEATRDELQFCLMGDFFKHRLPLPKVAI